MGSAKARKPGNYRVQSTPLAQENELGNIAASMWLRGVGIQAIDDYIAKLQSGKSPFRSSTPKRGKRSRKPAKAAA